MAAVAGRAVVPFSGDFSGLVSGAAATAAEIGGSFTRGILAPVTIVASAIAATAGLAVDLAAKYGTSLAMIQANMGITATAAKAIGDAFLSTAGKVTFSANDIAQAFAPVSGQLELLNGKALTAGQSLSVMNAAMALAEATGQPLVDTTAALVNVMVAYHEPVANAAAVTDLLSNAAKDLNQPVSDIASVIDKLHGKLGDATPPLAQVVGLMVDLAKNGVPARSVVADVSTAIDHLIAPSKGAAAEMHNLHLKTLDAHGAFIGMDSILGQLLPKYDKLTPAQQHLTSVTLFGAAAADAMTGIILKGPKAFDALTASVSKTGSAQQGAQTATDDLGGAWATLTGNISDFLTKQGTPLNNFLKGFVDFLNNKAGPALSTFAGWITSTVIPAAQQLGGWFHDHILPILQQVADWVTKTLVPAFQGLVDSFQKHVVPAMKPVVQGFVDFLKNAVPVGEWIVNKALDALKWMSDHFDILKVPLGIVVGLFITWKGVLVISALISGVAAAVDAMAAAFALLVGPLGVAAAATVQLDLALPGAAAGAWSLTGALAAMEIPLAVVAAGLVAALASSVLLIHAVDYLANHKPTASESAQSGATAGTTTHPINGYNGIVGGGHARGGTMRFGETAWLGEEGPEIGTLTPGGLIVTPHRQSEAPSGGHSNSVRGAVTIHQVINISGTTPESLLAQMDAKIGAHNAVLFNALGLAT